MVMDDFYLTRPRVWIERLGLGDVPKSLFPIYVNNRRAGVFGRRGYPVPDTDGFWWFVRLEETGHTAVYRVGEMVPDFVGPYALEAVSGAKEPVTEGALEPA